MNFDYELIVVILNEGHSDMVMDAARSAGAGGGTVLHAKGTGAIGTEKFFGVTLANEKDVIYIGRRPLHGGRRHQLLSASVRRGGSAETGRRVKTKPPLCKGRWHGVSRDGGVVRNCFMNWTIPQSPSVTAPFTQGSLEGEL